MKSEKVDSPRRSVLRFLRALLLVVTVGTGASAATPESGLGERVRLSVEDPPAEIVDQPPRETAQASVRLGRTRGPGEGARTPDAATGPGSDAAWHSSVHDAVAGELHYGAGSFASTSLGSSMRHFI
ncbi:hypothetical protein [Paraburkholderia oxyphila]|uniref:hypothetical protein n=1 Tax=Paraburkholderia oxyphila TaxID=614212 RepID=UPI0012ED3E47|nr:hypothetical protein [Paraburkholderia oxyphila]